MSKTAFVYILASKKNGTLYTGVTNNLERRMYEHKYHLLEGFTDKYDVTRLVWFAQGEDIQAAISLEKKIKNRNRQWKIDLIEKTNPNWDDLAESWIDPATTRRVTENERSSCAPLAPSVAAHSPPFARHASSCAPRSSSSAPHSSSCAKSQDPNTKVSENNNE
ncbi:MAG TPA: GIY-YIG nuclease family protein [Cellvibrionaceae bacterium]